MEMNLIPLVSIFNAFVTPGFHPQLANGLPKAVQPVNPGAATEQSGGRTQLCTEYGYALRVCVDLSTC